MPNGMVRWHVNVPGLGRLLTRTTSQDCKGADNSYSCDSSVSTISNLPCASQQLTLLNVPALDRVNPSNISEKRGCVVAVGRSYNLGITCGATPGSAARISSSPSRSPDNSNHASVMLDDSAAMNSGEADSCLKKAKA
jgi:hypothetical protein